MQKLKNHSKKVHLTKTVKKCEKVWKRVKKSEKEWKIVKNAKNNEKQWKTVKNRKNSEKQWKTVKNSEKQLVQPVSFNHFNILIRIALIFAVRPPCMPAYIVPACWPVCCCRFVVSVWTVSGRPREGSPALPIPRELGTRRADGEVVAHTTD